MIGIYAIVCKDSGHRYVGSSGAIPKRWKQHAHRLRKGSHENSHLQAAWSKYGEPRFDFVVLEECDVDALIEREQFWINELEPEYNQILFVDRETPLPDWARAGYKRQDWQWESRLRARKGTTLFSPRDSEHLSLDVLYEDPDFSGWQEESLYAGMSKAPTRV